MRQQREGVGWRTWGPYLSERQWGTVREDYSDRGDAWDYFTHDHARSACLPVGRGRHRRHQRRPATPVLRRGAVERARPDPQGAPLRADQQRRQPRRGREGVLLLRRQRADALLSAIPLQVPAGRRTRTRIWSGPNAARSRLEPEYELARHRRVRRAAGTSTSRSSTPRRRRTTSWSCITVHNRGPVDAPSTCSRRSGSATGWSWPPNEVRPAMARSRHRRR